MTLQVDVVDETAADDVHAVVAAAFSARPALDPPAPALGETPDSVAVRLADGGGLLARLDGVPVGALLFDPVGDVLWLRRFGVLPSAQGSGVARALLDAAEAHAAAIGARAIEVVARRELPATVAFWQRQRFAQVGVQDTQVHLARFVPHRISLPEREDTQELAMRLATVLRAGDLLILSGDLGAGKTTFTQGLGRGLEVRGDVTSPTFVIARVHPSLGDGPPLVHVDAYRLGGIEELDDLDLDTSLTDAVTVVEWGVGLAEGLADDRLEIELTRSDDAVDETRQALLRPVGTRWLGVDLTAVLAR